MFPIHFLNLAVRSCTVGRYLIFILDKSKASSIVIGEGIIKSLLLQRIHTRLPLLFLLDSHKVNAQLHLHNMKKSLCCAYIM